MNFSFLVALLTLGSINAFAANTADCVRTQQMAEEFISCNYGKSDDIECKVSQFLMTQPKEKRKGMIEAVANADACITGKARNMRFLYQGTLIGKASPASGITVYK